MFIVVVEACGNDSDVTKVQCRGSNAKDAINRLCAAEGDEVQAATENHHCPDTIQWSLVARAQLPKYPTTPMSSERSIAVSTRTDTNLENGNISSRASAKQVRVLESMAVIPAHFSYQAAREVIIAGLSSYR